MYDGTKDCTITDVRVRFDAPIPAPANVKLEDRYTEFTGTKVSTGSYIDGDHLGLNTFSLQNYVLSGMNAGVTSIRHDSEHFLWFDKNNDGIPESLAIPGTNVANRIYTWDTTTTSWKRDDVFDAVASSIVRTSVVQPLWFDKNGDGIKESLLFINGDTTGSKPEMYTWNGTTWSIDSAFDGVAVAQTGSHAPLWFDRDNNGIAESLMIPGGTTNGGDGLSWMNRLYTWNGITWQPDTAWNTLSDDKDDD